MDYTDIEKTIKKANQEYEKNGGSKRFEKAGDAIIKTGNAEYIYRFAFYVKGANIEKKCKR